MKKIVQKIIDEYLIYYPEERKDLSILTNLLNTETDTKICDINNANGHIRGSGFIFALEEQKFLLLDHKGINVFLQPGGHANIDDKNPFETSKREVCEETGIYNFNVVSLCDNPIIPIDIDTHIVKYNAKFNMPEHYHHDFIYLYTIDKCTSIKLDLEELKGYKWVDVDMIKQEPLKANITKIIEVLQNKEYINKKE